MCTYMAGTKISENWRNASPRSHPSLPLQSSVCAYPHRDPSRAPFPWTKTLSCGGHYRYLGNRHPAITERDPSLSDSVRRRPLLSLATTLLKQNVPKADVLLSLCLSRILPTRGMKAKAVDMLMTDSEAGAREWGGINTHMGTILVKAGTWGTRMKSAEPHRNPGCPSGEQQ